jgi:hypothetical protein
VAGFQARAKHRSSQLRASGPGSRRDLPRA